jgi:hypothetical protein
MERIALNENLISSDDGLLRPTYYISPAVDKIWLEDTLTKAFADVRHCVFPPDAMEGSLQMLHKLGYTGPLWDLLITGQRTRKRKADADH